MKTIPPAAALLALACGPASAATIPFGPDFMIDENGSHVLAFAVPVLSSGDAVLSLSITGDYDRDFEYADVSLDGLSLGRILNENGADDRFAFDFDGVDDVPRDTSRPSDSPDYARLWTSSAVISLAELAPLIVDGELVLTVAPSSNVSKGATRNFPASFAAPTQAASFVEGALTFDAVAAAVPLPAGLPLLLGGFGAFALLRRKGRRIS